VMTISRQLSELPKHRGARYGETAPSSLLPSRDPACPPKGIGSTITTTSTAVRDPQLISFRNGPRAAVCLLRDRGREFIPASIFADNCLALYSRTSSVVAF